MQNIMLIVSIVYIFLSCGKANINSSGDPDESGADARLPTIGLPMLEVVTTTRAKIIGKIENTGGATVTGRGICWATHHEPTLEDHITLPKIIRNSGEFEIELADLQGGETYYARAYATNGKGTAYSEVLEFTTIAYEDAKVGAADMVFYRRDAFEAYVDIEDTGGAPILEAGVCYALTENPTIEHNNVQAEEIINNNFFQLDVTGLPLGKDFFLRPYVKTEKGLYYGRQNSFKTFNKGKITVNFHNRASIPQDVFDRFVAMTEEGVRILEEYTTIEKTVTVEYNLGVPTADASFSGWMRFGSNASYQRTGTFLHEFSHTIGGGTTSYWTNVLIKDGLYTGRSGNLALQKATGDSAAQLKGDRLHWWPYGINGAHEDTGREEDYIILALILEGFKRDGLPIR